MTFEKTMQYLGAQPMQLKDGSTLYKVSLFDSMTATTVAVNVMGSNLELVTLLQGLEFGDVLKVTFILREKDNLYRLGLSSVVPA